jgi:lipopolysaccharide cholinephosphotransferase
MDSITLRKLQLTELEILVKVDEFCKKHNIKYSLYAGTALGAIRHGGFIPWDDDIDIYMERNEYNRFLDLWDKEQIDGFTLEGTNKPDYTLLNHSKIRKNGTILASNEEMKRNTHHGIWLDIFPMDKVPTDKKKRKSFIFKAKLRMVYTRGFPFTKGSAFLKLVSKILLIPSRKTQLKIRNKLEKQIIDGYKDLDSGYEYMSLAASENFNMFFPSHCVEELSSITFEGKQFPVSKNLDEFLTLMYGDYMQLPKEEDRICKHNPEVLDFGE